VTRGEHEPSASTACLGDEQLAAYVDGVGSPAERREVEAHLAACRRCRTVVTEAVAAIQQDGQGRTAVRTQTWPKAAIVMAIAATVLLSVMTGYVWYGRRAPVDRPELAELVAAAASEPTRLAVGRLTGGFAYKPPPVQTRGAADRRTSPELRIAAARIEQGMGRVDSPEADAALGTSYLAVGDLDRAIERLESAVEQRPDDARFQNDLAVAYIARASSFDRPDDWPKALAAAERAVKANPSLVEPCFNRALALEGLTLASEAAEAWSACAEADSRSRWAEEARRRAEAIRSRLRTGRGRPQSRQPQREEIEDRLLVDWAEAEIAGDLPRAEALLRTTEDQARGLAEGGDTMALDEVALIRAAAAGSRTRLALANAHLAYGRARQAFMAERLSEASAEMTLAAESFVFAGSVYAYWAPVYRAIPLWIEGHARRALRELSSIPLQQVPVGYYHLRGRVAWTRGMALLAAARLDVARTAFVDARDQFRRAGELEYESVNASYLANVDWLLGSRQEMWRNELAALQHVDDLPPSARRSAIMWSAAVLALFEGLPETALVFQQHLFHLSQSDGPIPITVNDPNAYLRRGQILGRLGDNKRALEDFARAGAAASQMQEPQLREWATAEVSAAKSEVLTLTDSVAAISAVDVALAYYQQMNDAVRVSELLLVRASAREARGETVAAAADYETAVTALEASQDRVGAPQNRKSAFDQQRAAVHEAVRFTAVVRRDPAAALKIAERGRARALRQRLGGPDEAFDPTVARAELPKHVAMLYFVTLPDTVLGWVLTTKGSTHFTVDVKARLLARMVRRLHQRIGKDARMADLQTELQFFKSFVDPALSIMAPGTTLVVVADEGLASVPFAALPDQNGMPLVATYPILLAPSFSTFVLASRRLAGFEADGVLAIGDGHDPQLSGPPRLPFADSEATEVSNLYPRASVLTGPNATAARLMTARQAVVHFAGHTIVNTEFPFLSRLLFAPDWDRDDGSGVLLATTVAAHRFPDTRVVVLASCESATGKFIRGEGVDSVARMFLDAGVPSVVASLWPVDDDQTPLFVEFHRQLRNSGDAAQSLRAAQIKTIGQASNGSLRRWAGFVVVGGINERQDRKDVGSEY
jgi:CHAT domain-containing protein